MFLPKDGKNYRLIGALTIVEGKDVYNASGKLVGTLDKECPQSQEEIMSMLKPATSQPIEEKGEGGLTFANFRRPGRPKKDKDE